MTLLSKGTGQKQWFLPWKKMEGHKGTIGRISHLSNTDTQSSLVSGLNKWWNDHSSFTKEMSNWWDCQCFLLRQAPFLVASPLSFWLPSSCAGCWLPMPQEGLILPFFGIVPLPSFCGAFSLRFSHPWRMHSQLPFTNTSSTLPQG